MRKKIAGILALAMCLTMLCSCTSAHNAVNDVVRENFGSEAAEIHDEAWRQSQFVMDQAKDEMKDEFTGLKDEFQKLLEEEIVEKNKQLVQDAVNDSLDNFRDELNTRGLMLMALEAKFPNERYWNRVGKNGKNNQHGWTKQACSTRVDEEGKTKHVGCNGFDPDGKGEVAWQCMGFAERLGMDATGMNPRVNAEGGWKTIGIATANEVAHSKEERLAALESLKPGDIVRYYTKYYEHSIYVTQVVGDTVIFADCNVTGRCQIRWRGTMTKDDIRQAGIVHIRIAPFEVK